MPGRGNITGNTSPGVFGTIHGNPSGASAPKIVARNVPRCVLDGDPEIALRELITYLFRTGYIYLRGVWVPGSYEVIPGLNSDRNCIWLLMASNRVPTKVSNNIVLAAVVYFCELIR